ncbi:uncharacterized protein JCM6883_000898 [Sporobolomyces salmoneus]|uniref:uncharacterized protein n=1 Tax=Sporobolomyces salmoneus TaxID=183962 RepID=UPI003173CEE6
MESSIAPPIADSSSESERIAGERGRKEQDQQNEVNTTADLVAGWLGGAVGVIAGNPFEVLKVRLQTAQTHTTPSAPGSSSSTFPNSPRVGKSSTSPIMLTPPPSANKQATVTSPNNLDKTIMRTTASSLQIPATSNSQPSTSSTPNSSSSLSSGTSQQQQRREKPSIMSLYRSEGIRFFFAGAAGPILGLAFIDSAFFGLYGRVMQKFGQDRQDPNALHRVFLAGATAGAACALLETPIEVVKTRAQVESSASSPGGKLGSFRIASMIAKKEGLRGFYVGGLMTSIHDGVSSGIFFATYFVFRRLLRGEHPFHQGGVSTIPPTGSSSISDSPAPTSTSPGMGKGEVARILLAGGLAGALSALIPYPFDIVKTRLQTANFESKARPSFSSPASNVPSFTSTVSTSTAQKRLSIPSVFSQIYRDSIQSHRYRYRSTVPYSIFSSLFPPQAGGGDGKNLVDGRPGPNPKAEKWTMRVLGLRGFGVGLRPTVVSSFVGSAATITTVEVALHLMGVNGGGGVG